MSSSQNSNQYINAKNTGDEHQRASPGLAMPIVIRRNGIGKNLQGKRGDGLAEAVIPKTISESGEKERGCFAAHTSERQQNPSDDPLGRGLHHNMDDRFPTANAKRERSFAVSIWHKKNNFLCGPQNQRNHDQPQRETPSAKLPSHKPRRPR